MTELKLEPGRRYWVRYKKNHVVEERCGVWTMARTKQLVGVEVFVLGGVADASWFDAAIPCDEYGWIDAKKNQPPEIEDSVILVCSIGDGGNEYYHTVTYGCGWYDNYGERCDDFTHWQPVNKWGEP